MTLMILINVAQSDDSCIQMISGTIEIVMQNYLSGVVESVSCNRKASRNALHLPFDESNIHRRDFELCNL